MNSTQWGYGAWGMGFWGDFGSGGGNTDLIMQRLLERWQLNARGKGIGL